MMKTPIIKIVTVSSFVSVALFDLLGYLVLRVEIRCLVVARLLDVPVNDYLNMVYLSTHWPAPILICVRGATALNARTINITVAGVLESVTGGLEMMALRILLKT